MTQTTSDGFADYYWIDEDNNGVFEVLLVDAGQDGLFNGVLDEAFQDVDQDKDWDIWFINS